MRPGWPVAVTDRMTLDLRRLIDRAGRWLLNYRPQPLAVGAEVNRFAAKVADLTPRMSEWLRGDDRAIVAKDSGEFMAQGVSEELAMTVATGLYQYSLLDVIDIADIVDRDAVEVADTYFTLMDHLGTDGLLTAISRLARDDRWHSLARLAIRDDIYGSLRALCFDVLAVGEPDETGEQKIEEWELSNSSRRGAGAPHAQRDLRRRREGPGDAVGGGASDPQHDQDERNGNDRVTERFITPVPVRWSDIDMYQHVNHGTMVTILEEARVPVPHRAVRRTTSTPSACSSPRCKRDLQGAAAARGFASAGDDLGQPAAGGRLHARLRGAVGAGRPRLQAGGHRRDRSWPRSTSRSSGWSGWRRTTGSICSATSDERARRAE